MMPIGPLMIEHRLIERMVKLVAGEAERLKTGGAVDPAFLDAAVDFIRTYADRCHHGKEEDILFRDLAKKDLAPEHKRIMDELVQEHVQGRAVVRSLVAAKERYSQGERGALADIVSGLERLAGFYPLHIAKEDKAFFIPVMQAFTQGERDAMLQEFWEFDQRLIHDRYRQVVEGYEGK